MFWEIILVLSIGIGGGVITGLIPGIHVNLVAVVLLAISPLLLEYVSSLSLVAFILAMSITHTFTDFIASVYLGAPDDDTALSVLPGHALLLQGKAFEAIRLTLIGSLLCLILCVLLTPLLVIIVPLLYSHLQSYIGFILLSIVLFMILKESSLKKKFWSFTVFMLAGILGLLVFSLPLKDPLFPLLSGIFGVSMLLMSLSQHTTIPPQKVSEEIEVSFGESAKAVGSGVFSGSLLSIFPGLGPAQAAILGSQFFKNISIPVYLILVGGINTVVMIMSLITLFTIDKARNGSIVAVQELLPEFSLYFLLFSLGVCLVTGGISSFAVLFLGKVFSNVMNKINYKLLSIVIIVFIFSLAFFLTGILGVLVLTVSTALGIIPVIKNVGRNHAMGVLLLPVILYFLL